MISVSSFRKVVKTLGKKQIFQFSNPVTQVEKFEISQEAYEAKEDTVQAFKKRNKLGDYFVLNLKLLPVIR